MVRPTLLRCSILLFAKHDFHFPDINLMHRHPFLLCHYSELLLTVVRQSTAAAVAGRTGGGGGGGGGVTTAHHLFDVVRGIGHRLQEGHPVELCIGNIVRRVLYVGSASL
jgi:hypothetical protein